MGFVLYEIQKEIVYFEEKNIRREKVIRLIRLIRREQE